MCLSDDQPGEWVWNTVYCTGSVEPYPHINVACARNDQFLKNEYSRFDQI